MSTGSGRRERACGWLEATGFLPSAALAGLGGSAPRAAAPGVPTAPGSPHSAGSAAPRATGWRTMQVPLRRLSGGHGGLRGALGLLLELPDFGQRVEAGGV